MQKFIDKELWNHDAQKVIDYQIRIKDSGGSYFFAEAAELGRVSAFYSHEPTIQSLLRECAEDICTL